MPRITSIKQQRHKDCVNVYLDGEFGFGIHIDNFVKLGLRVEQELGEEEIEKIVKTSEFQKTMDKLLNFAMLRPRSEREIENWFVRKKVHESLHEKLFKKLRKLELIDDTKFARWWVEQRQSFRPRGRRALVQELRAKGIDKNIIEDVLAEGAIDETKIAKELIRKNAYKWERYDEKKRREKKIAFLQRKGFGWDVIGKID